MFFDDFVDFFHEANCFGAGDEDFVAVSSGFRAFMC